jgi:hypothetical protein
MLYRSSLFSWAQDLPMDRAIEFQMEATRSMTSHLPGLLIGSVSLSQSKAEAGSTSIVIDVKARCNAFADVFVLAEVTVQNITHVGSISGITVEDEVRRQSSIDVNQDLTRASEHGQGLTIDCCL